MREVDKIDLRYPVTISRAATIDDGYGGQITTFAPARKTFADIKERVQDIILMDGQAGTVTGVEFTVRNGGARFGTGDIITWKGAEYVITDVLHLGEKYIKGHGRRRS